MIELVGSKVVARRPTDTAFEDDVDDEEAMTTLRAPIDVASDTEPYQTPVALTPANRKYNARVIMTESEDSPSEVELVERSDIEKIRLEDIFTDKKGRKVLIRAADRVRTIFRD
jgi:hypothetical protein